jgi:hypothetical protein
MSLQASLSLSLSSSLDISRNQTVLALDEGQSQYVQ